MFLDISSLGCGVGGPPRILAVFHCRGDSRHRKKGPVAFHRDRIGKKNGLFININNFHNIPNCTCNAAAALFLSTRALSRGPGEGCDLGACGTGGLWGGGGWGLQLH